MLAVPVPSAMAAVAQALGLSVSARREALTVARRISVHHQDCRTCQRGGRLTLRPGGLTRVRCEGERGLFAELGKAQQEGWPDVGTVR